MQIQVLGPLVLRRDDRSATPTAPKPRSVLALLLLHTDQTVPVSALTQELWGDAQPASALTTLQTYIVQLRKLVAGMVGASTAEVTHSVLVTAPGGYLFRAGTADFDLREYERLAASGQRALAAGDNAVAADLLMSSRDRWRGPALADVVAGRMLEPQVKRLEEARLSTIEHSVEARLRLGRHHDVLPELAGLLPEHPQNENLHAQMMVALHRCGRRQEALRMFQQLRRTMTEELGLEPSRRLHLLQQAVLADNPVLDVDARDDGLAQTLDRIIPRGPVVRPA